MKTRTRLRTALLASTLGLAPLLVGCLGASDDKLGSGNASKAGGSGIDDAYPIKTSTQQNRDDKGDNPQGGNGTGRPDGVDASKTGGLGGTRDNNPPGPGDTGPRASAGVSSGPK